MKITTQHLCFYQAQEACKAFNENRTASQRRKETYLEFERM